MPDKPELDSYIAFFEADVLNLYICHPNKYELDTDYYGGVLKTTDAYYYELESAGRLNEYILQIRFAYHRKKDGTPCIGVFIPDLKKIPEKEQVKWGSLFVQKSLLVQEDERFNMWYERYIKGSWNVPIEPRRQLSYIIKKMNACCKTLVDLPLYTAVPDNSIIYPIAQNSHAYEDAHRKLYGFLVDSLSKDCLLELANIRNKTIDGAENMKTKTLLRLVFNEFDKNSKLHTFLAEVSEKRRQSSHGVREAAKKSNAFEDFRNDLEIAVEVYEKLLALIETEFNVLSEHELRRHEIMEGLPKIVRDAESHYSICQSKKMEGKTVEKVWFGMREEIEDVHQSEVLYMQFTDGEILAMQIGSNALDFLYSKGINPNELNTDLILTWVPAASNRSENAENDD